MIHFSSFIMADPEGEFCLVMKLGTKELAEAEKRAVAFAEVYEKGAEQSKREEFTNHAFKHLLAEAAKKPPKGEP